MGITWLEHKRAATADFCYIENRLPFYVMNLCPALYWSWNKAKPVFFDQYASFERNRDRRVFVRTPA